MKRILILLLFFMMMGCDFPHDCSDSWTHAESSGLKVGVAETLHNNLQEKEILQQFAKSEHLTIHFVHASETELRLQPCSFPCLF